MMGNKRIRIIASFFVVLLVLTLALGCGHSGAKTTVNIKVGVVTDLTGSSAAALKPYNMALEDIIGWFNENEPIPNVKVSLVSYDTGFDYARVIPAWTWLMSKGCDVVYCPFVDFALILKPFAERDKTPVYTVTYTSAVAQPLGWVFSTLQPEKQTDEALAGWIVENWPNYPTKPKFGVCVSDYGTGHEMDEGVREFCQAHSDKAEYVGTSVTPIGTYNWAATAQKFKDADYVFSYLAMSSECSTLFTAFKAAEFKGKIASTSNYMAYHGIIVDSVGKEAMDGTLACTSAGWWTDSFPLVDLAKTLLAQNRPGEAESLIHAGNGYLVAYPQSYFFLQILKKAVDNVGSANFDGQAFYDAALDFSYQMEGYPTWSFTPSERDAIHDVAVYEYQALRSDYVKVSDWIPLPE